MDRPTTAIIRTEVMLRAALIRMMYEVGIARKGVRRRRVEKGGAEEHIVRSGKIINKSAFMQIASH
jgi:hypothetical protein